MSCGCGKPRDNSVAGRTLRDEKDLALDEFGLYTMTAAPDCEVGYHGAFPVATVYVVGRNTDKEQLFTRKQYSEAQLYARQNDLGMVHVAASNLCHDTILAFLGA